MDANKNIVRVVVESQPNSPFHISTNMSQFWLFNLLKPASESQERFLKLLEKSELEFLPEKLKAKFVYAVEDIQTSVQKAEDKFLEFLGEREFWEYLKHEVEFTKGDLETCCRIQAIFHVMGWPYHFVDLVEFSEEDYSVIKIGGHSFYCNEERFMESVTTRLLCDKYGLPQWKLAVQKYETQMCFEDWCEHVVRNDKWVDYLGVKNGRGDRAEVEGATYWVGQID